MTLVGRDRQRSVLRDLAARAAAGCGGLAVVTGEAWMGKSAVVRAALDDAGIAVVHGVAAAEHGVPYAPLAGALRELMRHGAPRLGRAAAPLAAVLPELASDARPAGAELVAEAVRTLLAGAGPLAVVLDDMQWTDPATAALLVPLALTLAADPVLVVVVARAEETPPGHPLRRACGELRRHGRLHEIAVDPLTEDDLVALVGAEAAVAVARRAGGSPFLALELARGDVALPERVRDAVLLRVDALPAAERRTLAVAALLPGSFDPELVDRAGGGVARPETLAAFTRADPDGRQIGRAHV